MQLVPVYGEGDVEPGECHAVHAFGLVLAAGAARVLAQHLDDPGDLVGGHARAQLFGEVDVQLAPRVLVSPAPVRVGMAIGEGDVGLDVEDGRAVAQVGAAHVDDGAFRRALDALELHAAQTQGIRAEGAARGEHADALRAAKPRRAHGRRPFRRRARLAGLAGSAGFAGNAIGGRVLGDVGRPAAGLAVLELPQEPQVRELVESRDGGVLGVFRLENDTPLQMRGDKTVARDAEFLRHVRAYMCDRRDFHTGN